MANRYWVGGTAAWDATVGTKWATTSGGAGGAAVPTAADDVFLDGTSGAVTVTIPSTPMAVCRSLNCTGFTGTLSMSVSAVLRIGDATAGAGNIALLLSSSMTLTISSPTATRFDLFSTSSTTQAITTNGKTMTSTTINGAGSSYQLTDSFSTSTTATITLTAGTLDTNGQTCSWGGFSSAASGVRTLTLGTSTINLTGTAATGWAWLTSTTTNMTFSGLSSVITATSGNFNSTNLAFGTVTLTVPGILRVVANSGSGSFINLTIIGNATKTCVVNITTPTVANLTLTGSSTTNRLFVTSNIIGSPTTITAAAVSLTNVDFIDIAGAGAAAPFTGTSLGDALGNSGITFDAPVTQTHTASAGGNWSDVTKWTSRVPLPQDNVVVNASTTGNITLDMPRLGADLNFSGYTGTPNISISAQIYGSITLGPAGISSTFQIPFTLAGRSSHTITSNGAPFSLPNASLTIGTVPTASYTLGDALIYSTTGSGILSISCIFNSASFNITTSNGSGGGNGPQINAGANVTLGTSTLVHSTFTVVAHIIFNCSSGATLSAASATFSITSVSPLTRTFAGGGKIYGTINYTVANSPGTLNVTGANTLNNLNVGSGRILTMPSSTVTTINSGGSFNVNGVNNGYVYLPGVVNNYLSTPDSAPLSITGDIDMKLRIAMDDWTPPALVVLFSKMINTAQYSYDLLLNASGTLSFRYSTLGSVIVTLTSAATGLVDGSTAWIRATRQSSTGNVKFYTSTTATNDPSLVVWTQLGSTVAGTAGAMFDGTDPLVIGGQPGNFLAPGKYYRANLLNGYDGAGTLVFDADFTTKPFGANSFIESSLNAATVTVNGSLAQAGDGRVSLVSSTPGTPAILSKSSGTISVDYLTIQDSTATGGAAWYAGANSVNVSGNSGWIFGALGATAAKASNFLPFFGGSF